MTGSLQHMGDDKWRVTVYIGIVDGKQKQKVKSFHAPTRQAAKRTADGIASDLRSGAAEQARDAGTFAAYFTRWLDEVEPGRSPTTMKGYRSCGKRLTATFGAKPLADIGAQDVRVWHAKLAKGGMSAATIDHHHALLSAVLRQAVRDELIPKAATFGAKRPKREQREISLPKHADVLKLIDGCAGDLRIAIRIAAACGLRRGEVIALRWSDIVGREILASRAMIEAYGAQEKSTKGKRDRRVSLDYHTLRMLAAHRRAQVAQAAQLGVTLPVRADRRILANMAVDPTGRTPYSVSWFTHGWTRARGVSGMRLHDLRHWYAKTILESQRATVAELSEWLGHAQVSTTLNIYARHTDPVRRRVSGSVMGGVLGPG